MKHSTEAEAREARFRYLVRLAKERTGTWELLAEATGISRSKLQKPGPDPRLDFMGKIAEVLGWPVGRVAEDIAAASRLVDPTCAEDFETLDRRAIAHHRAGEYRDMIRVARAMHRRARSPEERATACNRECGGWDGRGQYEQAIEAAARGLREVDITRGLRAMLEVNLANAYFSIGKLVEARGIATDLLHRFEKERPGTRRLRAIEAHALYVGGASILEAIARSPNEVNGFDAARAARELELSRKAFERLYEEYEDEAFLGFGRTVRAACTHIAVEIGRLSPREAIRELESTLDSDHLSDEPLRGDRLESRGWIACTGCAIALRHLPTDARYRTAAVFLEVAREMAEQTGNWRLHERVFTMEHTRLDEIGRLSGSNFIGHDEDDRRRLVDLMARFPRIRDIGWQLLESER